MAEQWYRTPGRYSRMALSCSPHAITALTFRADRLPRPIPKKYPPLPRFPHTVHEKTLFGRSAKEVSLLSSKDQGCSTNLHRGTSPTTCRRNEAPKLFTSSRCRKADTKKAVSLLQLTACFCCGAPEEIRTPGLQVRSLLLYPAELRARCEGVLIEMRTACQQSLGKKTNFFETYAGDALCPNSSCREDILRLSTTLQTHGYYS